MNYKKWYLPKRLFSRTCGSNLLSDCVSLQVLFPEFLQAGGSSLQPAPWQKSRTAVRLRKSLLYISIDLLLSINRAKKQSHRFWVAFGVQPFLRLLHIFYTPKENSYIRWRFAADFSFFRLAFLRLFFAL